MDSDRTKQQQPSFGARTVAWFMPGVSAQQVSDVFNKFNLANILFCYCIPFFYVFYPTLLMPAIFLRSLSFLIGWMYRLVSRHHSAAGHSATTTKKMMRAPPATPERDDEMNNMYFWLQRCSICLDQTYSLCLESCRDQFCKPCFARYVEETVHASWGLGVTRIQCPVCQEPITQAEWSRYVSADIVDKYKRYNQPYRPFTRHCPSCKSAVIPCQSPRQGLSRERRLHQIVDGLSQLEQALAKDTQSDGLLILLHQARDAFQRACRKGSAFRVGRNQDLYNEMVPALHEIGQQRRSLYHQAANLSKQLVALEIIPEAWKQTQFWHVARFPIEACSACGERVCLQCGENAHPTLSCTDQLRQTLAKSSLQAEWRATVQWKLNHTRPCPNCSVMINRDEGCNRVDCLLCGHRFCWSCGCSWSQRQCGFYQCDQSTQIVEDAENTNNDKLHRKTMSPTKAELGVPDMEAIDARRQSIVSDTQ